MPLDGRSAAGRVVRSGEIVRQNDLRLSLDITPAPGLAAARAELAVPVLAEGQVLAVLLAQSSQPGAFRERDAQSLSVVAAQITPVLAGARRLHGEQARRRLAEGAQRVSQTLNVAVGPESVTQLILDQVGQVLPYDRSALFQIEGDLVEVRAARGLTGMSAPIRLHLADTPLLARIATAGTNLVIRDTRNNSDYRPLPGGTPACSWLGTPLKQQNQVIGILVLECDEPGRYGDEDARSVAPIAGQAAVVLENARLAARTQELTRQLEVVSSVNQLVQTRDSTRGLPGLLRTVVHQIRLVVPCDVAVVALYDPHDDSFSVEWVHDDSLRDWTELPPAVRVPADGTPWQSACTTQGPVEQPDLARADSSYARELAAQGLTAGVVVPITGGEHPIGAIGFASRQPEVYGQTQVATLMEIARQLGTMLYKERLARDREETAIELARSREHLSMVDKVRLVGQLASGVAHDFNNLLAGVLGNAQLLLLEVEDPEQREMLKVIERAAKDGTETVRRIQGFARVQADELVEVRLDLLARDAIDITRPRWRDMAQARGATIEIVRRIEPVTSVLGRSGELREVLSNLIINAADALPRGGTITVATYDLAGPAGAEAVVVEVGDNGTGIAPEIRSRIFDPFFTTKGEKGTGLGLAVSLSIIQRHSGTIDVESDVGHGTTFRVQLPVRADERTAAPTGGARDEPREPVAMQPGHILFVESEAMIRVPIERLLRYWGHTVTTATSGAEALAQFEPNRYDLAISDLGMPGMSGWELLAEIKRRDPTTATVLLTGWARQDNDERAHYVDIVLEKPFDQGDLRAIVAEALARRA
jgi:signal transduction histidine kinase/CheY-like chemotaxis protein